MTIDPTNFLHSLATFIAAAVSPAIAYAATPRALWLFRAREPEAADPYSVLRIYPGSALFYDPLQFWSVQCETTGQADAAITRSQALFATLLAADGTPLHMKVIAATKIDGTADTPASYRLVGVDLLQRPGILGSDDKGRHRAVFNFDVGVAQF